MNCNPKLSLRSSFLVFALLLGTLATVVMIVPSLRVPFIGWCSGEGHHENKFASAWIEDLKSDSATTRFNAVLALSDIEPVSDASATALIEAMQDKSPEVRAAAAKALGGLRKAEGPVLTALENAMSDGDVTVRIAVTHALGETGTLSPKTAEVLMIALNDKTSAVRAAAVESLSKMEDAAIPLLIKGLDNESIRVQRESLNALALCGGNAESFPRVLGKMEAQHPSIRRAATAAISKMDQEDKRTLPAILKRLDDEDVTVRLAAVEALEHWSIPSEQTVTRLVLILQDQKENSTVRKAVAQSLSSMGVNAKSAIPALTEAAKANDDDDLQDAAEDAVKAIKLAISRQ